MTDHADDVIIRDLVSLDDYLECCEIQDETWGRGFSERVPGAILRVSQKIGGVTAGAFDRNGRMLGFVFGMTGVRDGALAHWSDMLAVRAEAQGRHLGDALKHYQRERVRALGCSVMLWTFDPLVSRNAHFNINRLRAFPVDYVADMYGSNTGSTLHGELPTDRFVARWDLQNGDASGASTPPGHSDASPPGDDAIPLGTPLDTDGSPTVAHWPHAGMVRVQIPHDFSEVQRTSTDAAMRWRLATREVICELLGRGFAVRRFVRPVADAAERGAALPYYVFAQADVDTPR